MSNIFHDIKRGFLIVGITGPLSSGCTTAANFFENEINSYITKRCDKALSIINSSIQQKYQKLKVLREELKESKSIKYKIHTEVNKLSHQIKEQANLRETLTVLDEYKSNNFKHISMTDMLLKITIERLSESKEEYLNEKYKKLKNLINFNEIILGKSKELSRKIKNREISEITEEDINLYGSFLQYIPTYRKELKANFTVDELGNILQDLGDNARRCGNPLDTDKKFNKENASTLFILAEEANNIVKFFRNKNREKYGKKVIKEFVIEAFRNPYEIEYFRNRYFEFFLFSIYAPLSIRKERGNYNKARDQRDRGHGLKVEDFYKQNVSECVHLSDIAINNDSPKKYILERKLSQYFSLICRPGCIPPSDDELFMQQAYCMSVKSNCISRQVGAVIVGKRGYIVGAGWNDVGAGQIPCGLRRYSDINSDEVNYPIALESEVENFVKFLNNSGKQYLDHSYCFKDEYSKFKTTMKVGKLNKSHHIINRWSEKFGITPDALNEISDLVINNFSPKRLEYCRALHAEENAILQNSIIGGIGIEGATIYSTTFPCELCAKKIYQSRIKKVVYTEPYPESISEDVFFKDGSHTIELVQFEGVKSYSYYRLYKASVDKKEFQIQERIQ